VGAILGPAVAFTPVDVLTAAGPAGLLAWPIAMLLLFPVALTYVELGAMWPRAGGVAYYPTKSHGALVGVLNGWGAFLGYVLAPASIIIAFVEYLSYFDHSLFANGNLTALGVAASIGAIFTVFLINILRIKRIGDINNLLTVLTIILIVILVGALLVFFDASNFTSRQVGGFFAFGGSGVFVATSITVYGYGGFRQPIDYAEELKDPGRSLPRAVIATMLIVALIYFLESLAFAGAIRWAGVGTTVGNWGYFYTLPYPFVTLAQGAATGSVLTLLILVAIFAALIASYKDGIIYFGGASRVGNTMARYDNFFPQVFSRLNRRGVPFISAVLALIVTVIFIVLFPSFSSLFSIVVDGLLVSYAPGAISLAVFRKQYPDERRPYLLPLYQVLAPVSFIVASLLIFWSGWTATHILIVAVLIGLVFLAYYHHKVGLKASDFKYGIWYPVYFIVVLLLSYSSSTTFGGRNYIPFPYDTVAFIVAMIIFYIWGYYSGIAYIKERGRAETPETQASA
jgi:amino acid transporter